MSGLDPFAHTIGVFSHEVAHPWWNWFRSRGAWEIFVRPLIANARATGPEMLEYCSGHIPRRSLFARTQSGKVVARTGFE
jgi:hypothetical protein